MKTLILVCIMFEVSFGVIYELNETEYNKMPALFSLDDYDSCITKPGDVYCLIDAELYSDNSSDLIIMIEEYSKQTIKHYNHRLIHRGICVKRTCHQFYNESVPLNSTLGPCINESIWKRYKIGARLLTVNNCNRYGEIKPYDAGDIAVGVIYLILIAMNVAGSWYDAVWSRDETKGNPYMLAFSLQRNWKKLTGTSHGMGDQRLERLKLFHGLRTMTMLCVFFSHTVLIMAYGYIDNPLFIEKAYKDPAKQILFNGSLVISSFFIMSTFLLTYNFQLYAETHEVTWIHWPKGLLLRWFRLTPTYALMLATLATWMRYLGSGPMWDLIVGGEAAACKRYWWSHLLYINNYLYDDAGCAPQTWYLAADTQLFCIALFVLILARTPRVQTTVLVLMLLSSLLIVAAHTYFQDLEAVVLQSPETYRNLYASDDTFRLLYIRGHTNMSSCTVGLAAGYFTYHWTKKEKKFSKKRIWRWLFWAMFPLGVTVILTGGFFYSDGGRVSTVVRVLYATLYKTVFQIPLIVIFVGVILKIDNVYRGIIEWRGFTWTGRVSYSAFLLHTLFQRGLIGAQARPTFMSDYYVFIVLTSTIFMTYICAVPLWLFVEAPMAGIVKAACAPRRSEKENHVTKI